MGLLSDPEYGSEKWIRVFKKVYGPFCALCYAGALVWFVMLGNNTFNNETYFSENALLPGLVRNEFNGEPAAKVFYNDLNEELKEKYEDTNSMPVPWLVGKMSQLNLEVYTHNFTLNYPLGEGQVYKGTNVYGILRAPRTSSLEAVVISVPFRPLSSHQKGTTAGIALMLAFAQFARPQKYWAKDIIFLVTEHEQLGMQAWLEAYHGISSDSQTFYQSLGSFRPVNPYFDFSKLGLNYADGNEKCLDPGKLKGRSGSIQAAINLEFDTPKIKYLEVKIEGLNGQLPNLDLGNLVHKLCDKSGIHHSYKNSFSWISTRRGSQEWWNSFVTLTGMLTTQLAGVPNGNHGLFHRFGIEAVTLEGRNVDDPAGNPPRVASLTSANFYRLGITLESIMRSLNNLLERFHQSYFFYMLAATNRFISIGQYMISLCLLCTAILIKSLILWSNIQNNENKVPGDKENKEKKIKNKEFESVSLVHIGFNYFFVHLLGYITMNIPLMLTRLGSKYYNTPSEEAVYYGLLIISLIFILIIPFSPKLFYSGNIRREEVTLINVLVLIELATICLCVSMHNFSLGFCIGTLYTPLALVVGTARQNGRLSKLSTWFKRILCLLLHPLSALSIAMIVYSKILFPEDHLYQVFVRGRDAAMQAIMFSIVDSMIYGNWLFNVMSSLILPTWLLFWQIVCVKVK